MRLIDMIALKNLFKNAKPSEVLNGAKIGARQRVPVYPCPTAVLLAASEKRKLDKKQRQAYNESLLSVAYLRYILRWSEPNSCFFWRRDLQGQTRGGDKAGCLNPYTGYEAIMINGIRYYTHRLLFLYENGRWPKLEIDHKLRDKKNSIINLREAAPKQNSTNQSIRSNNTSGMKGVSFVKSRKKWLAQLCENGKNRNLGRYNCPTLAIIAYDLAAIRYDSEFSVTNFPKETYS